MVAGLFLVTSISSCKKCGYCTYSGTNGPEYCEKNSQTVYDAAKTACSVSGGTWTTK